MRLILLGYRGSGKSTVGRLLAGRLGIDLVDTDAQITTATGRSIATIFADEGEAGFRRRESAALQDALRRESFILATGGGAVLTEENRSAMRAAGGERVYLNCDPAELARRITADAGSSANRPALTSAGSVEAEVAEVLRHRHPLYMGLCTRQVDVTLQPPAAVADAICAWIGDDLRHAAPPDPRPF